MTKALLISDIYSNVTNDIINTGNHIAAYNATREFNKEIHILRRLLCVSDSYLIKAEYITLNE